MTELDNYIAIVRDCCRDCFRDMPCEWREDDDDEGGVWDGSCGVKWMLETGTPEENGMAYCPRCGRPLVTATMDANHIEAAK